MDPSNIPGITSTKLLDVIQFGFIEQINDKFSMLQNASITLLATVAALELAIFGLVWVIKQDEGIGLLVIKFLKIGLFFVIIQSFPMILQAVLGLFIKVGYIIAPEDSQKLLFSPAHIWDYGFKSGVSMLKLSAEYGSLNFGFAMIYLVLGFGTLLIYAAIGAQVIVATIFFYFMAVVALIVIPLGVLKPMQDFFNKAIQHLIRAGVRLFAVILVLGVAFTILSSLKPDVVSKSTSIEIPLALFFAGFVIMILIYKLPTLLCDAIGKPGGNIFEGMSSSSGAPSVSVNTSSSGSMTPSLNVSAVGTAASMSGSAGVGASSVQAGSSVVTSGAPSVNVSSNVTTTSGAASIQGGKKGKMDDATSVNRSISDSTIKKIK